MTTIKGKRVQPMSRSLKDLDDFFNSASGGIFDRPAKVAFKDKQKPAPGITIPGVKTPQILSARDVKRLNKLEAILKDPAATEGEKQNARAAIKRIRG